MRRVVVTGSAGFIGGNLIAALMLQKDIMLETFDVMDTPTVLERRIKDADVIYHLAGVNRPERPEEYEKVNWGLTEELVARLEGLDHSPVIVFSSSIQAALENPYGISKRRAEETLCGYAKRNGAPVIIFRLPNVFGKWCRPNYNSVVATYCHNISQNLNITISDPDREIDLVYIDDVVRSFVAPLNEEIRGGEGKYRSVEPTYRIALGELAKAIYSLRDVRRLSMVPDLNDRLTRCLYATYVSYLRDDELVYDLEKKVDQRGQLAELLKSQHFGQIFVSRTKPGVTRGNHYHETKIEKFCVLEGEALIRLRHILSHEVITYRVSGEDFRVVDIPPGYTHSIENIDKRELLVLFWASEPFSAADPDTYACEVLRE